MSMLHTSKKTHREMLPQSRALESVSADNPQGRDETGYGRGRKSATGVQHGRGESRSTVASVNGRHPESDSSGSGVPGCEAGPNRVFVLDRHGDPLMPCHSARARKLLACGRARVVRHTPFVIRLVDRTVAESEVDGVQVGVDPGSRTTGLAVFTQGSTPDGSVSRRGLVLVEAHHRSYQISQKLKSRAALRRGRRTRNLRYRQPRFLNRAKPAGWLAPSLRHRVETTDAWVERLCRWAPVTAIHMELVRFDTAKMQNPEISGVDYQRGTLHGYEVREYLIAKFNRKCVYCGIENVPLNIDHIHPRSKNGSNRVSNLVLSCIPCNQTKGSRPVEEFVTDPARLKRILAQAKAPLRDAAAVNSTRWALRRRLDRYGVEVHVGTGGQTKWNRTRSAVPKTHALDALCVGDVDVIGAWPAATLAASSMGRGSYSRTRSDRYGFPRLRLTRTKQHHGFATGDLVRAVIPTGKKAGTHTGRVAVRATGSFNIRTAAGTVQGIGHRHCRLIQRSDGWAYQINQTNPAEERSELTLRAGFCLPTAKAGGFPPRTPPR
jgi:5-methylcytosine-specific restriction endonuclease McrA